MFTSMCFMDDLHTIIEHWRAWKCLYQYSSILYGFGLYPDSTLSGTSAVYGTKLWLYTCEIIDPVHAIVATLADQFAAKGRVGGEGDIPYVPPTISL